MMKWRLTKTSLGHLLDRKEKFKVMLSKDQFMDFLTEYQQAKKTHWDIMVHVIQYLTLEEMHRLSQVNMRLYLICGD